MRGSRLYRKLSTMIPFIILSACGGGGSGQSIDMLLLLGLVGGNGDGYSGSITYKIVEMPSYVFSGEELTFTVQVTGSGADKTVGLYSDVYSYVTEYDDYVGEVTLRGTPGLQSFSLPVPCSVGNSYAGSNGIRKYFQLLESRGSSASQRVTVIESAECSGDPDTFHYYLVDPPDSAYSFEPLTVQIKVSAGPAASGPLSCGLRSSTDGNVSGSDNLLTGVTIPAISGTHEVILASLSMTHKKKFYMGIIGGGCGYSAYPNKFTTFYSEGLYPQVIELQGAPQVGSDVTVAITPEVFGSPGALTCGVYLSSDSTINGLDTLLGDVILQPSTQRQSFTLSIPDSFLSKIVTSPNHYVGIYRSGSPACVSKASAARYAVQPPAASNIHVSGTIQYERPDINTGTYTLDTSTLTPTPIRNVRVELLNYDNSVVSSTVTDESGLYSFNGDVNGMFKVRALAEMKQSGTQSYHFQVKNIATGKPGSTFALQSSQAYISGSCTSGNCTLNLTALHSNRSNGPFAILDGVKYALDSVLALDSSIQLPELHLRWSSSNSSGSYFTRSTTTCGSVANCIAIKGASSDSDEFDWHVITHEFTHYLEANLARSDSIGGPHTENDLLDPRVAYGEGLANAIGAIFLDDPVYIDTANGGGFSFDMENGTHTLKGYYSESSVQSIIWDLYDSNNEGLDNLTLGLMPIWSAMRSLKTTDEITYLHPFVSALKVGRPGDTGSINAILSMENVATDANGESDVSADVDSAYTALGVTGHNCAGSTMEYAYNPILENVSGSGSSVYSGTHKGSQLCGAVAPGLNKLFGSQFIRVTPDYSGVMQITVTDTDTNDFDDPDVFVYQAGDLKGSAATDGGETLNVIVDAGKVYIVEIRTFDNCMAYILQTGSSYYCTSKAGEAEYTATIDLP